MPRRSPLPFASWPVFKVDILPSALDPGNVAERLSQAREQLALKTSRNLVDSGVLFTSQEPIGRFEAAVPDTAAEPPLNHVIIDVVHRVPRPSATSCKEP